MEKIKIKIENILLPDYLIECLRGIDWLENDDESVNFYSDDLILMLYGTRGSTSFSGPGYIRYGANTTSYQIFSPKLPTNTMYLGDGGSGILEPSNLVLSKCKERGKKFFTASKSELKGVINNVVNTYTHYHYDHLHLGGPLSAIYHANNIDKTIIGADNPELHFVNTFQHPIFPVSFDEIAAAFKFYNRKDIKSTVLIFLPNGHFGRIGISQFDRLLNTQKPLVIKGEELFNLKDCIVVKCYPSHHPDPTISFRYETYNEENKLVNSIVFLTDHEIMETDSSEVRFIRHVSNCDFLYIDGQYDKTNYNPGFGHGRVEVVAEMAAELGIKNVAIGHHDPSRKDHEIDEMIEEARKVNAEKLEALGKKDFESRIMGASDRMMVFVPSPKRGIDGIVVGKMDVRLGNLVDDGVSSQHSLVIDYKKFDLTREYFIMDYTYRVV